MPGLLTAFIIGIGPGGKQFLTPKAEKIIDSCGVVVGWAQALNTVRPLIEGKMVIEQTCADYQNALSSASETARSLTTNVAVLVADDPLTYSAGLDSFKRPFSGFKLEIIPAISSFQLAAAAAKISLEDSLLVVYAPDAQGNIDEEDLNNKRRRMLGAFDSSYHLIIMSDLEQTLGQTAAFLIANGLPRDARAIIGEQIGTDEEVITTTDLESAAATSYHWMSMMIIKATAPVTRQRT
ncbi:precorrin-6y C5,15-methyltransferase (decarboxylating) subunit CbiE [Dehalogenimonas sp. THU2]|uniref:precorrin-6y C5,15-methyltransferase (decarboxylating) subunit CbiE n=1 Tax=Dehalogenimonas sp. THU2 TaxID=3151121 RepID=UPI003218BBBC